MKQCLQLPRLCVTSMTKSNIKNWTGKDWIIADEIIRRGSINDGIEYMQKNTGLGIAECSFLLSARETWIKRYKKGLESGLEDASIAECNRLLSVREITLEEFKKRRERTLNLMSNLPNWNDDDWINVNEIIRRSSTIDAIKYMQQKTGLNLFDCRDIVEERPSLGERQLD